MLDVLNYIIVICRTDKRLQKKTESFPSWNSLHSCLILNDRHAQSVRLSRKRQKIEERIERVFCRYLGA